MQTEICPRIIGRFAPSPTGPLHIGSLVAAVGSYMMAKCCGGQWLLRIDDLDSQRCRPEFESDILRTIEYLGLYWDGEISRQSSNISEYESAFEQLLKLGLVYPCCCSRSEIARSASAPHPGEEVPYPGTCRTGMKKKQQAVAWRLLTEGMIITFEDLRHGRITKELDTNGDFVIRRVEGFFAYQLAVVVDDYLTGVNQVVRGDDLLGSTPRQVLIHQLLDRPLPVYCHLPLVTGPNGAKLSKRDCAVSMKDRLAEREAGLLIEWCLNFLGFQMPEDLHGAPPPALFEWGIGQFRLWLKGLMIQQNSNLTP